MQINKSNISHIIIAVCTYKRENELDRCILSLSEMNFPYIKTEILIVDNDLNKSAEKVYNKYKNQLDIHYIIEERQGLSNVRNKALKEAIILGARAIAFPTDNLFGCKSNPMNIFISSSLITVRYSRTVEYLYCGKSFV